MKNMILSNVLFLATIVAAVTAAPSQDGRIVGGVLAELGEFPYVVSMRNSGSHSCGGSIISEEYVLTAAHCIPYEEDPALLQIQYGVVDRATNENIIDVKRIIKNNFNPAISPINDVALLELNEKIKFGPNVQPIQLPNTNDYPGDNATAVLVGWGRTETNAPLPTSLQKVNLILFTHSYCKMMEEDYSPEHNYCAGVPLGGQGQCNGDSGGPLTVNGVQYGVVSWSTKPCASQGHPGVFSSVVTYRNWIKENSGV